MDKRTQLNINIDEVLLKELKKLALSENLPLSVFIRNSLRKIVSGKREEILPTKQTPFTENHALNCTSFMKGIFQKMRVKNIFRNDLDAFNNLLSHIEKSKQWSDIYTKRLKEVLLDDTATPFKAEELKADKYGADASESAKVFITALSKLYIYDLVWNSTKAKGIG